MVKIKLFSELYLTKFFDTSVKFLDSFRANILSDSYPLPFWYPTWIN